MDKSAISKKDKVDFIIGLYDDTDFTPSDKEIIFDLRENVIEQAYDYFRRVIEIDETNTDNPKELPTAKETIKIQLLKIIKILRDMDAKNNDVLNGVWEKLKRCINFHKEESIKILRDLNDSHGRNSSFYRTDWSNCCRDDLKEIAKKLAKQMNKNQIDDKKITENIHIACSVVISYYLIQQEWDSIALTSLHITGPSEWTLPTEWSSKKYFDIIPFTVMCWINEKFGFDDTYKKKMVNKMNGYIVGIATKGLYDGIDLSEYHKMIVSSGEFVHYDSDGPHYISPAVHDAMHNDALMAAQTLARGKGGERNRSTHRRTRVSSRQYITKYKRTKSSKHKRTKSSKHKRTKSSKHKRII